MRRLHESAPHRQRRADDFRAEVFDRRRRADDVDDRVDRADLVEMHVVLRHAMHVGLGLREPFERKKRARACRRVERRLVEHLANRPKGALRLRRGDVNVEVRGDDSASLSCVKCT